MFGKGRKLYDAVMWGQFDEVRRLLRMGVDPKWRNGDGWSPVHVAANNDHECMIPLLWEAGADVEAKTKLSQTALHIAVQRLNLVAANELLECGANPNARDGSGNTSLQELSRMERIFGEPMVLNGVRISNDEQVRECQALAIILVRKGAVP